MTPQARTKFGILAALAAALLGLAGCSSGGGSGGGSPPPPVPPPPPPPPPAGSVTVAGDLNYEFPPPNANCNGLNFLGVIERPIRQATVQLLDSAGTTVLASTVSDDTGAYSLTAPPSTDAILRVRAELLASGWNVQVRNNVDLSANPPPLSQRPIYALDHAFNTGTAANLNLDLLAETGWGVTSYTGPRSAAPFSVLDTIYTAMAAIRAHDPSATFPALDAFWSPDNTSAVTGDRNEDTGEIGTSYYSGDRLFLLGKDGDDTEEFDVLVVAHEWSHYFEDNFSRSDSIGGQHGLGNLLDKRVAFGEGFATAMAGILLQNPQYCDTFGFASGSGFRINLEGQNAGTSGWYNEVSVLKVIYDLWDTANDGADTSSVGFGPIYDVMTGPQAGTEAFTSIFSFATHLKQQGTGQNAFIDALLNEQQVNGAGVDVYGSAETNDGPGTPQDVLPVYTNLTFGVPLNICVNNQYDSSRSGNKLSEHRYLRLNLATARQVTFSMINSSPPSTPPNGYDCVAAYLADPDDPAVHTHSDPDFVVYRNGTFAVDGTSCEPNSEVAVSAGQLPAGNYVIDINEFRHADEQTVNPFPSRACFDFTAQ